MCSELKLSIETLSFLHKLGFIIYARFPGVVPVSWPPWVLPMHGKESGWLRRSCWFTCGWGAGLHWQLAKILTSCCTSFPLRLGR